MLPKIQRLYAERLKVCGSPWTHGADVNGRSGSDLPQSLKLRGLQIPGRFSGCHDPGRESAPVMYWSAMAVSDLPARRMQFWWCEECGLLNDPHRSVCWNCSAPMVELPPKPANGVVGPENGCR